MRVSKETAVLLKDAGFKWKAYHTNVDGSVSPSYLPTLHEAADWLRSNGVHLGADWDGDYWFWYITLLDNSDSIVGGNYDTHDSAYEAGIVHGLKYIK